MESKTRDVLIERRLLEYEKRVLNGRRNSDEWIKLSDEINGFVEKYQVTDEQMRHFRESGAGEMLRMSIGSRRISAMISKSVHQAYYECFGEMIFYLESGGSIPFVQDDKGTLYALNNETDETILAMIEESKRLGRNVFFEKCPSCDSSQDEYLPDVTI